MAQVTFELVSPERLLLSKTVDMVVLPGSEGLFGVLGGHAPLIATLRPGVLDVHENGAVTDRIFVGGGFAEVTPDRCVVLAETATPMKDLDRAAIAAKVTSLSAADPAGAMRPIGEDPVPSELDIARAMLAAIDGKPF
jgi:F-type H+-transporting ATPase subunit epsilon